MIIGTEKILSIIESHIKAIFGNELDINNMPYKEVYKYELKDIAKEIRLAEELDLFSAYKMSVIIQYLFASCFGDTVSTEDEPYASIAFDMVE